MDSWGWNQGSEVKEQKFCLPQGSLDTRLPLIPRDPTCYSSPLMKVAAYGGQVIVKVLAHFLKRFYLFIFRLRKRGGGREGEKHQSVASCMHPDWGLNLQPRNVPWPGIELVTFCFAGWCPTNWATLVRAAHTFLTTGSLPTLALWLEE